MITKSNRIKWIDMAKGYGIIAVILGHLFWEYPLRNWIYSFHMPLFFFLSGYTFRSGQAFRDFLQRKIKTILVPYFALAVPMVLFVAFWDTGEPITLEQCLQIVVRILIQKRFWTLWFLACLFVLNLIFYAAERVLKSCRRLCIFSIGAAVVGLVFVTYVRPAVPWNVDVALTMMPFFFCGYFCKCKKQKISLLFQKKSVTVGLLLLCSLVNVAALFLSLRLSGHSLEVYRSDYGIPVLSYISAFFGIFATVIFSKLLTIAPIRYIGKNSMLYYMWHQTIFTPVSLWLLTPLGVRDTTELTVDTFIILFAILLEITVVNEIITRTKLRFMVGK